MNEPDNISGEKLSSVETDNKNKKEKRFSLADTLQFICDRSDHIYPADASFYRGRSQHGPYICRR